MIKENPFDLPNQQLFFLFFFFFSQKLLSQLSIKGEIVQKESLMIGYHSLLLYFLLLLLRYFFTVVTPS